MNAEIFLDTNLLLYAFSSGDGDRSKSEVCKRLLAQKGAGISTQVLQEFINNALRKRSLGISEELIDVMLQLSGELEVAPVTHELLIEAVFLRRRYQISHWDSTILAAAQKMRCSILYSEDFSHGQWFDSLQVINPFRTSGL